MRRPSPKALDIIGTLVRLGLAAMWLIYGAVKFSDPGQTYVAVRAFDILPGSLVGFVATTMPLLELVVGVVVLAGLATRFAAAVSVLMLLAFIAAIAQAWARGLTIDCGCLGGGGQVAAGQTEYPQEILRDVGYLLLAGWLTVRPRTLFSLDGWLGWNRPARDEYSGEPEGT
ncbi:MauE/DoxX family redox-associated membrane protein [Amycolatopsis anabasis]|uniref:MauE/DoxX family redox-associated membrane protein n=1 Tax=Amycolatopsis anabasis TaxID=1840409 RepID=UPI0024840A66|nr:MauE/DoxX family redox-associated membrane protein [Amycolatopsis anabasis]